MAAADGSAAAGNVNMNIDQLVFPICGPNELGEVAGAMAGTRTSTDYNKKSVKDVVPRIKALTECMRQEQKECKLVNPERLFLFTP